MFSECIEREHWPEMDKPKPQLTFTSSKATIETLEKGVKYVQS